MDNNRQYPVEKMCKIFQVSRSSYYEWIQRKPSKLALEQQALLEDIRTIYSESKSRYGSYKIAHELVDRGWAVSRPRVARMMKKDGLRSIIKKRYRQCTTKSNHKLPIAPNHLDRNFHVRRPAEKWVSDITYIRTIQGWLYLTIIMDLYDRKIVGWALSTTMMTSDTIIPAWRMAIKNRPLTKQLIFHSDRGVQYASLEFRSLLGKELVLQSMSRKGNCWDNAVAENFFKIIKSELVYHQYYHSIIEAKIDIFEFIEIWYNRKRKHSYLGYKTPQQFGQINYLKCA